MYRISILALLGAIGLACLLVSEHGMASEPTDSAVRHRPAAHMVVPEKTILLGGARAGSRLVAVGDRGVVLLSDDIGANYRQATHVPTRATLNAVTFVDALNGWAVGHWGVILRTRDGGETWTMQRDDTEVDQPLFSVWFENGNKGYAAGLWSLLLMTVDGGETWEPVDLSPPEGSRWADRNLFSLFSNSNGDLFIAAEQGLVYKLARGALDWRSIETGNKGTFWTGVALKSGTLLVAGLQGKIYRSADSGESWNEVLTPTSSSITAIRQMIDGTIVAVGLDGLVMRGTNDGLTFESLTRDAQIALTAIVGDTEAQTNLLSMGGIVKRFALNR